MKNIKGLKQLILKQPVSAMKWTGFNIKEMQEFTGVEDIKENAEFQIYTPVQFIYVEVGHWVMLVQEWLNCKEWAVMLDNEKEILYKEVKPSTRRSGEAPAYLKDDL